METTGQNYFVSEHLSSTELYPNWGTSMFDNNPTMINFEEFNYAELQRVEHLLDEESPNQSTSAQHQDVTLNEYALDLERMLLQEQLPIPTVSMPESVPSDECVGVEIYPNWDTTMFDNNPTMIDVEELSYAESDFQRVEPLLDGESFNQSINAQNQDVTLSEFAIDLERMLLEEQQLCPTVSKPELAPNDEFVGINSNDSEVHENRAAEHVVVPRPVVPPAESIGVTYHRKNKQWEAHLWLKGQQLRNQRKKKGVQLFLGNFATSDEAKQAHDRAAIKLEVRETARGKAYPLNFPESAHAGYIAEHAEWSARDFLWKLRRSSPKFNKGKSCMKGVSVRRGRRGGALYEAKISQTLGDGEKRTFDLGKFASEEAAGMAYDRGLLFLKGAHELTCITNFRPSDYSAGEIQEAGSRLAS